MSIKSRHLAAFTAALLALPLTAGAHLFVAKPQASHVAAGAPLTVSLTYTEELFVGEHLPKAEGISLYSVAAGKRTAIAPLSADEKTKFLNGTATAPGAGAFAVVAETKPSFFSKTADGVKPIPKGAPGAELTTKAESFAKVLVNLSAQDEGYKTPVGNALEIVPVTNPALAKNAGKLQVRVLFNGKPVATQVVASPDGFKGGHDEFAVETNSDANGIATIAIDKGGLWLIGARHSIDEVTATHDRYSVSANLVFSAE